MLESLEQGPNIKDLSIEDQTNTETPFDPEKDIPQAKKDELITYIEGEYHSSIWSRFTIEMSDFIPLFPELAAQFIPPPDNKMLQSKMDEIRNTHRVYNVNLRNAEPKYGLHFMTELKILSPQTFPEEIITEDAYKQKAEGFVQNIENYQFVNRWDICFQDLIDMKIIYGDQFSLPTITDQNWEVIKYQLKVFEEQEKKSNFISLAAKLKLLFPAKLLEFGYAKLNWKELKASFQEESESVTFNYLSSALDMKILAAQEVKITDNGYEFKMGNTQDFTTSTPPLPETRNF